MPRHRELADVADGISGHFIRDWPWDSAWWPLGAVGRAFLADAGTEFAFVVATGAVTPTTRELDAIARQLRTDLGRHLAARQLKPEWVRSARLTVSIDPADAPAGWFRAICRMEIVDDRGRTHSSTRRTSSTLPRVTLLDRLKDRLLRRRVPAPLDWR